MASSSLGVWHECWGYIGVLIFLAALASLAVALRFWSRRITHSGTHTDDWLALFTLFVHHGLVASVLVAFLADGLGFNTPPLSTADPRTMELQKLTFIGTLLYGIVSTSVRLAVIIFYLRVLPSKVIRRGGYTLAVLCVAWFIATEGLNLGTCQPVAFRWNRNIAGGHCINTRAAYISIGAINLVIDAATVCLPVREVMKLELSGRKKIGIFAVFLLGGIATLACLARLIATSLYVDSRLGNHNGTTSALLWAATSIEIYVAIIAACAPTLGPTYNTLCGRPVRSDTPIPHRSGYTSKPGGKKKSKSSRLMDSNGSRTTAASAFRESDEEERPFKRFDDIHILVPAKDRGEFWTNITARPASQGVEPGRIRVQRDVTWN